MTRTIPSRFNLDYLGLCIPGLALPPRRTHTPIPFIITPFACALRGLGLPCLQSRCIPCCLRWRELWMTNNGQPALHGKYNTRPCLAQVPGLPGNERDDEGEHDEDGAVMSGTVWRTHSWLLPAGPLLTVVLTPTAFLRLPWCQLSLIPPQLAATAATRAWGCRPQLALTRSAWLSVPIWSPLRMSRASSECPTSSNASVASRPASSSSTSSPPGCWCQRACTVGFNSCHRTP